MPAFPQLEEHLLGREYGQPARRPVLVGPIRRRRKQSSIVVDGQRHMAEPMRNHSKPCGHKKRKIMFRTALRLFNRLDWDSGHSCEAMALNRANPMSES